MTSIDTAAPPPLPLPPPKSTDSDDGECSKHMGQIRTLLNENKTLKTNMYWLVKELKTAKNKDNISRRLRLDSGGLEEGRSSYNISNDDKSTEICECMKGIVSYVRKLERMVSTLKAVLEKNNSLINDLLLKKYGHIPKIVRSKDALATFKLTESYVTINSDGDEILPAAATTMMKPHDIVWDSHDDDEEEVTCNSPELEHTRDCFIVPLEDSSSDGDDYVDEYEDEEEEEDAKENAVDDDEDYLNLSMRDGSRIVAASVSSEQMAARTNIATTPPDERLYVPLAPPEEREEAEKVQECSHHKVLSTRSNELTTRPENEVSTSKAVDTTTTDNATTHETTKNKPREQQDTDPLNTSQGEGALRNINCPCNLPLSLIRNLELQRTQTYLTSKKSSENLQAYLKKSNSGDSKSSNNYKNPTSKQTGFTGSPLQSPIGSPMHEVHRNVAEMFEKKNNGT